MSLTGTPKATFLYPRIKFGTTPVTIDAVEPTNRIPTIVPYMGLRGSSTVASGRTEYLFGRTEEQVGLVLRCEQDQLAALRWFVQDFAAVGSQFQTWVDRFQGSCWVFENNRKDQNGLVITLNGGGTETYAATANGNGIALSGSQYLSVATAQASAGTSTGYDDPIERTEGVLCLDVKPAFAANDGVQHFFLDGSTSVNKIQIYKHTDQKLYFSVYDASLDKTVSGTVTWSASDRVQIVALWPLGGGTPSLWYAVNGGAFTALTTASGSGTGTMAALPTTLYLGADNAGGNLALGTYDTVAFFKRAFATPQTTLSNYRPIERNYFPYSELVAAQFQPSRVSLGRTIWDWPIQIRNGVTA